MLFSALIRWPTSNIWRRSRRQNGTINSTQVRIEPIRCTTSVSLSLLGVISDLEFLVRTTRIKLWLRRIYSTNPMHSEMLFSVFWQAREPRLLTLAYKHNMKTFTKNKTVQKTKLEFGQSQLDASLPWHSLKLSAAIIDRRPWFLSSDTSNQILTQTHLLKPIQCALKCCSRSICKLESLDRFNFTRRWLSEQYTWRRFAKRKQNGTIHRQMWNRTEPTRCTSAAVFGTRSPSLSSLCYDD